MTTEARRAPRINRALDAAAFGFLIAGVVIIPLQFWPWSADVFVGPKFDVLRALTAGGVIAAAVRLVVERPKLRWRVSDTCVVVFLALNIVAFGFSVDRQTSLLGETLQQTGLVAVLAFAGAYAIARSSVRNLGSTRTVFVAVSASASITALYALAQLADIDPLWSEMPQGRVFSTLGQPNWLAAYLVLAIPLTVALTITSTRRIARLGWIGAAVLQAAVLVSTLSRSGYAGITLACVVGVVLTAAVGSRISRHRNALVIATAMLLSAAAIVALLGARSPGVAPENIAHRAFSAFDVEAFESQQYISLWNVGLAIAMDHPLTGAGQNTYAIMFPQYRDQILDESIADYLSNFRPESAHNVYVSIAAASGFPALAAYLTLVVASFTSILLAIRRGQRDSFLLVGLAAAIAGHVVTDAFMTIDLSGTWLFWALMGTGLPSPTASPIRPRRIHKVGRCGEATMLPRTLRSTVAECSVAKCVGYADESVPWSKLSAMPPSASFPRVTDELGRFPKTAGVERRQTIPHIRIWAADSRPECSGFDGRPTSRSGRAHRVQESTELRSESRRSAEPR